ncbi:serine/threonine-protein kinase [Sorangium sp. So ce426]|uniref:serine/threonine-protein kinase n=1 Tax=Sorangium sp. So ce426 TaxID=3133312 RepID=UPI003F5BA876
MIGTLVDGKYRIVRQLGAGAMGAVYQAEHTGTGRRVALKVITGDLGNRQEIVDRFWREARAAGRIETQHITQVLDSGVEQERNLPYLVMEMLAGEDLQGFLKRTGPVAPDLALRLIGQACLGLQKAHEAGVVHRDIKPANMFLARFDGRERIVKLLDFGIAKLVMEQAQGTESAGLTKTGSMLGSPLYMSPEQALGSKQIDHRSDLWSLGVALYQALAGRTPFDHIGGIGELIVEIIYGHVAPVQHFAPWVPPETAAIVHRALHRKPEERFQSAAEMLAAIQLLLPHGLSITDDILVPLPDAVRARVEPRLPAPSSPSLPDVPAAAFLPQHPQADLASPHPGHTGGAMARSHATPPHAASPPKALLAISAAALITAGVVAGGYMAVDRAAAPAGAARAQTWVAASFKAALAAPAQSAAPAPTPPPAPVPPTPVRTVQIEVIPREASVEVDDKPAQASGGVVEITGAPGSRHRVRVFMHKYSTATDVVVTESGPPTPARVVLSFSAAGGRSQLGGGATSGQTTSRSGGSRTFE